MAVDEHALLFAQELKSAIGHVTVISIFAGRLVAAQRRKRLEPYRTNAASPVIELSFAQNGS